MFKKEIDFANEKSSGHFQFRREAPYYSFYIPMTGVGGPNPSWQNPKYYEVLRESTEILYIPRWAVLEAS